MSVIQLFSGQNQRRNAMSTAAQQTSEPTPRAVPSVSPASEQDIQALSTSRLMMVGMIICFGVLGSFGAWATFAPLNSAVLADGFVNIPGYRRKVQHLEGGIIEKIFVKEGQRVEAGQPLVKLENKGLQAQNRLLRGQFLSGLAIQARLIAEQNDEDTVVFQPEVLSANDPAIAQFAEAQRILFNTRRATYTGSLLLKDQRIEQYRKQIDGIEAQSKALRRQIQLIDEEVADQEKLWKESLTRKSQMLQLKRQQAGIESDLGRATAEIARLHSAIAEVEEDKLQTNRQRLDDVAKERKATQDALYEIEQKLLSTEDALSRLLVTAPEAGIVVGLAVNTARGVLAPRETMLEIVPQTQTLTVEANIRPSDIDIVRKGLPAQVQIATSAARRQAKIPGRVVQVSADRLIDTRTNQPYFKAQIELDKNEIDKPILDQLYPGMPTAVYIETGARSFARYLLGPLISGMERAGLEH